MCLHSGHETSVCPQNPWNRCRISGCYGGHHYLLHPEAKEATNHEWQQKLEIQDQSPGEEGPVAGESAEKVSSEVQELTQELRRLSKRMTEFEEVSKDRVALLEEENNDLRKELKEARESHGELALEVRGLKDRIASLESTLLGWEQQKASTGVSQVGCLGPDPGDPREQSRTEGNPDRSAVGKDLSDDELLAELEAYELEQGGHILREEPRSQEVWWGDILEHLREAPLKPEPVEIMRDLIQFEKDQASVPDDVFGTLNEEVLREGDLSLLLEEFTNEKDWGQSNKEVLVLPGFELKKGEQYPSDVEWSTLNGDGDSPEGQVARDNGCQPPVPSLVHGWELISSDHNMGKVLHRLAYIQRFINSCRRKFRPMSRDLSTVEVHLARKRLTELGGQGAAPGGESSVGWRVDLPQ